MRKLRPKGPPGEDTKAGVSHTYPPQGPGEGAQGPSQAPPPPAIPRFPPAVEHGPDPRGKLMPGKGLDNTVVGARPGPDCPVGLGVLSGQHDHRHIRPLAQALAHVGASWPRGMRSSQVHPVAGEHLQRVRAGRADRNPETRFAQQVGKGGAERLLILHQGHTCHVAASRGGSCSTGPLSGGQPAELTTRETVGAVTTSRSSVPLVMAR
jgi:hypothetical protein